MTDTGLQLAEYFRLEADEILGSLRAGLSNWPNAPDPAACVDGLARGVHSLKGAARIVDRFDIGDIAHAMEDKLVDLRSSGALPTPAELQALLEQTDEIERLLEPSQAAPLDEPAQPVESVESDEPDGLASGRRRTPTKRPMPVVPEEGIARVATQVLDDTARCAGELEELGHRAEEWVARIERVRRDVAARARAGQSAADLVPVLDGAVRTLASLQPLGRRLRQLSLDASMVSFSDVAHRFERTLEGAARDLRKQARLEIRAHVARLDRQVLQRLIEPIAHLLRNAVAHGIEAPEERSRLGKPSCGLVVLTIDSARDGICITVEDDGRGLDAERIRGAAARSGDDESTDELDITELIFQPGLTTEERPTQVAGRGVGLDAVRCAVQELRGEIRVQTEPGRMCRFELSLPSNIDVLDVFVVQSQGQSLLFPLRSVARVERTPAAQLVEHAGRTTLMMDDRPVPVHDLATLLELPCEPSDADLLPIVVVRSGRSLVACVVDALAGRERVVVKRLAERMARIPLLSGAVTMGDGRPGFLLDPGVVVARATEWAPALARPAKPAHSHRRSVLIVDDSLTTRMLEKSLLESAGYLCRIASNGYEALEVLADGGCDLAVMDLEMPEMDGIELAQRIRTQPEHADLPMVMLTSRGSDEDKQRGMAAGMDAYLVKGQFDQSRFLTTIHDLVGDPFGAEKP